MKLWILQELICRKRERKVQKLDLKLVASKIAVSALSVALHSGTESKEKWEYIKCGAGRKCMSPMPVWLWKLSILCRPGSLVFWNRLYSRAGS